MLYDERYQPKHSDGTGGKEPPVFSADGGFGQYTHTYRNGVRARRKLHAVTAQDFCKHSTVSHAHSLMCAGRTGMPPCAL